jgi:hypothetical protein
MRICEFLVLAFDGSSVRSPDHYFIPFAHSWGMVSCTAPAASSVFTYVKFIEPDLGALTIESVSARISADEILGNSYREKTREFGRIRWG